MLRNKIISQDSDATVFEVSYKGKTSHSLIDTIDFNSLPSKFVSIKDSKQFYLKIRFNGKDEYLHRVIMNFPKGLCVDHQNRNKFDNRKENLRVCSQSQNLGNRIKNKNKKLPKGVYQSTTKCKYTAQITLNRKTYHLGTFSSIEDATKAYSNFGKHLFGEYFRAA